MNRRTKTVHVVAVTDKVALRKVLEEFVQKEKERQAVAAAKLATETVVDDSETAGMNAENGG